MELARHHRGGTKDGTTTLSSVERTSKKEYGEQNQRTVSFLLLPFFLILDDGGGGGSAIECSVLHHGSFGCSNSCFVRFDFRRNRFYVRIVSVSNNATTNKSANNNYR